jgi:hypothetical protein
MASEEKSFENLLAEAPAAPSAGTVSLVGALAQSCETGKHARKPRLLTAIYGS